MGLNMHHQYIKGLTGRSQGGWCSACCPDGVGVVRACMGNPTQVQILFPSSQIRLQRIFCVICRSTSVPPQTPMMNYFTGSAPLRPQCYALMPAPSWMPQRWQRPLSQQALKHPAPEWRGRVECHCGSHRHRSLSGPSCCHERAWWVWQWQLVKPTALLGAHADTSKDTKRRGKLILICSCKINK